MKTIKLHLLILLIFTSTNLYVQNILSMNQMASPLILLLSSDPVSCVQINDTVTEGSTMYLCIVNTLGNFIEPQDCELTSNKPAIATVTADGAVFAVAPGTAKLSAMSRLDGTMGVTSINVLAPSNVVIPKEDAIKVIATETGLTAQFQGEAVIELYTINGMLIDKAQAYQSYSRDLNKGVYVLRVNGQAIKFVK